MASRERADEGLKHTREYGILSNLPPCRRPTWAEVDLGALAENYKVLCGLLCPGSKFPGAESRGSRIGTDRSTSSSAAEPRLIPVIKADAYGHGAPAVARALAAEGATAFAVAIVEEGVALRQAGINEEILVLEGAWPGQEKELVDHHLTSTVYSVEGIERLEAAARAMSRAVSVHIEIDTGMARLGAPCADLQPILHALTESEHLRPAGTFSHLSSAKDDPAYTLEQIRRFRQSLLFLRRSGFDPGEIHLANSAGLLYFPEIRGLTARPGIALYGYPPAPGRASIKLRQVLSLKTRVGHLHDLAPGCSVGYDREFIAPRPMRAATLPCGYGDGYRRSLAGRGNVIIHGRRAAVLGAISMDMTVIDVTEIPEVREGDEVILLGSTPHCRIDAAVWSDLLETIPYEVLCGISARVPRVYIRS